MPLTLDDRQQIQDLLVRYAYAIDIDGTEEDLQRIFTDDAVIDSPIHGGHSGVEGIRKFAGHVREMREEVLSRHYLSNFIIDGDGDSATLKAYFVQLITYRKPRPPRRNRITEFLFAGNYDCLARKVDGQWRLARRTGYIDAES
jgi:ketosteroid isomerase-like protein